MFYTITNVQRGQAVPLQQYIDNRNGDLRVGLRSITYSVGWFNIHSGESISWRNNESKVETAVETAKIPPGLYDFSQLKDFLKQRYITIEVSRVDGLITLNADKAVHLTDGILTILGLDDGLDGKWLASGKYTGDRPVNFAPTNMLHLFLEQINTTLNIVDGAPSALLELVGVECQVFGDTHTDVFEHPKFKCLQAGTIHELEIKIRDDTGKILDNHGLPISLVLEVRK